MQTPTARGSETGYKNALFATQKSDYTGENDSSIVSRSKSDIGTNHLTKNEENGDTNYGNP